jgi:hypothetical protein
MESKPFLAVIILLAIVVIIWAVSTKLLIKHSKLKGKAKYIYAFSAFPVLVLLSTFTVVAGAYFAPGLMDLLTEMTRSNIPKMMQGLSIVPIFGVIPLCGFYLWLKLIKYLDIAKYE